MSNLAKKFFSLPLLALPLLPAFGLSFLPHEMLKKTPLYTRPLAVSHIMAIKNIGPIDNSEQEELYTVMLSDVSYAVKTTRPLRDANEKKDLIRIMTLHEDSIRDSTIRSKEEYLASAKKVNLVILLGRMNRVGHIISGIFFTVILFSSLALYLPIAERIVKVWQKNMLRR